MKYIIGNWKANKTMAETTAWLNLFISFDIASLQNVTVIICPPFPFIPLLRDRLKDYKNIVIGAQTVSHFETGPHTGEVTAKNLSGLVTYSIIGHSERREFFNETDEQLAKKTHLALKYNITPLYCVRGESDPIPSEVEYIVYEPVHSIGTGMNAPINEVIYKKEELSLESGKKFIYGGSVIAENAKDYLQNPHIDGVLSGGASLDPQQFYAIIRAAI